MPPTQLLNQIGLFQQEEVSQEDASKIPLFEDVNYKVKAKEMRE